MNTTQINHNLTNLLGKEGTQTAERLSKDEVITAENVIRRGEYTAIRAVKTILEKSGDTFMRKTYRDLRTDIHNIDVKGYVLTESYDIVQEAIAFLCGYIGRKLTDIIPDRKGEPITILKACFRVVNVYVKRNQRKACKTAGFNDLPRHEITVPFEDDIPAMTDYTGVDEKIKAMKLTARESEVLSCRMSGKGIRETARTLSVFRKSVQYALQRMQVKYIKTCNTPQLLRQ